jgi:hypothetical protein
LNFFLVLKFKLLLGLAVAKSFEKWQTLVFRYTLVLHICTKAKNSLPEWKVAEARDGLNDYKSPSETVTFTLPCSGTFKQILFFAN